MKQTNIKITRYAEEDHYIDIVENGDQIEAWLVGKGVGESVLMFGMSMSQTTRDEFMELVEANLPDYIQSYELMLEDGEK